MPDIYPLFRHLPFDPERVALMAAVFEQVSLELGLARHQDRIRDIVAKAIIDCAHRGIVDPGTDASMRPPSIKEDVAESAIGT